MPKPYEKQERIEKLNKLVERLRTHEDVKTWLKYDQMTQYEKHQLLQAWNKYFQDIKNTKAYRRYQKMRELLAQGRIQKIQDYRFHAQAQLEKQEWELTKPALKDPLFLEQCQEVNQYRSALKELTEMDSLVSAGTQAFGL